MNVENETFPIEPSEESIADGAIHSPDPRSIRVHRIVFWITTASVTFVLLLTLLILLLTGVLRDWLLVVASVVSFTGIALSAWWSVKWPEIRYRHTFYRITHLGIEIRRGVVWRRMINVPRTRIQHTDVSQGPLERAHGLGTVVMHTAGTTSAEVALGGLDHARALRIRSHLLPTDAQDAV